MNAMDVALICKALGDANRLEIVQMLSDGEKCGYKLLERFEITQPTLSHDEFSGNIVANTQKKQRNSGGRLQNTRNIMVMHSCVF